MCMVEETKMFVSWQEDLSGVWAFLFDHVEKVYGDPTIIIEPVDAEHDDGTQYRFHVVVSGTKELGGDE